MPSKRASPPEIAFRIVVALDRVLEIMLPILPVLSIRKTTSAVQAESAATARVGPSIPRTVIVVASRAIEKRIGWEITRALGLI
jgi:hypothetical protein